MSTAHSASKCSIADREQFTECVEIIMCLERGPGAELGHETRQLLRAIRMAGTVSGETQPQRDKEELSRFLEKVDEIGRGCLEVFILQ